ncbi:MAG: hypothetical protein IMX01_01590 [Limnochordaceae bacterium]|nr:hypothetical protein [Limnochordaceae bacterium]
MAQGHGHGGAAHRHPAPHLTIWRVGATLVGTVVGAGFASGQELHQFFGVHGAVGPVAALLAGVLLAAGLQVFLTRLQEKTDAYPGETILLGFVSLSLPIMLAGGGAALQQQLGWPTFAGEWLLAVAAVVVLWPGIRGLTAANQFFVPLLSLCFVIAAGGAVGSRWGGAGHGHPGSGLLPVPEPEAVRASRLLGNWLQDLVIYAGYNGLLALPVIAALARNSEASATSERALRKGVWVGGLYLGVLAAVGTLLLLWPASGSSTAALPLLQQMRSVHPAFGWLYWLALLVEMWNTAVAALFATADFLARRLAFPYRLSTIWVASLALLVSPLGFVSLVGSIYPALGYIALLWFGWVGAGHWLRQHWGREMG